MPNVDNYFEQAQAGSDNKLNINGSIFSDKVTLSLLNTVTLAEVNAGKVLLAGVTGKTITVLDFKAKVSGTFLTGTSIEVEDTNSSPVAIASTAAAGITDTTVLNEVQANTTMGAGYLGDLTAGEGIAVTKTGSDFTGGTSITFKLDYVIS